MMMEGEAVRRSSTRPWGGAAKECFRIPMESTCSSFSGALLAEKHVGVKLGRVRLRTFLGPNRMYDSGSGARAGAEVVLTARPSVEVKDDFD